jgi:S1-C subfamily serine protease
VTGARTRASGLACLVLLAALGSGWSAPPTDGRATAPAPTAPNAPAFLGVDRFDEPRDVATLRALEAEVKDLAARLRPTVVLLQTRGQRGGMSSGTGVIIGSDGLVATCGHVGMSAGRSVQAVLADGTRLRGRTLGQVFSGGVDCGLVQLETEGRELPAAPLGTTVGLARGDWVLAFGHTHGGGDDGRPALLRVGRVLGTAPHEVLMDAPIDAGDSGGPAFNLQGELIGLNSRCGRASAENIATPVDDLVERMEVLRARTEEDSDGAAAREPRRRGRPTNFPSGSGDSSKIAIQRLVRLKPVVVAAQGALARVFADGKAVGYATVVDRRGLAITKASLLPAGVGLDVEAANRQRYPATAVARDPESDVALLLLKGVGSADLAEVEWAPDAAVVPGTVLLTPRARPEVTAFGFAAIEGRTSALDDTSRPYMGLRSARATAEALEALGETTGVVLEQVVPGGAADRAGLRVGDVLLAFEGAPVADPVALRALIGARRIGDRVRLELARGSERQTVSVELGARPESMGGLRRGNTTTPISRVSGGLGEVIPHDTVLAPDQMGGPVTDLDGRVVGVNIARYDRTATHALPAARVQQIVTRLRDEARRARESGPPQAAP